MSQLPLFIDHRSPYNATVYTFRNGHPYGVSVGHAVEINGRLQLTRGNASTCTGYEDRFVGSHLEMQTHNGLLVGEDGDAAYDIFIRAMLPEGQAICIIVDECQGYRNAFKFVDLPPAYKQALRED